MKSPREHLHFSSAEMDHSASAPQNRGERARTLSPLRGHVLVPMRLEPGHRSDAKAALQMVAAHRPGAVCTVLHVLPPEPDPDTTSFHWLNAIDHLHRSVLGLNDARLRRTEKVRSEITAWIESDVPPEVRRALAIHSECRVGEPAVEIARLANEQAIDLLILCRRPSSWRLPLWPRLTDRIVDLTEKPVMLVRPPHVRVAAVPC